MAEGESQNIVGSAAVEVVADLGPFAEQLQQKVDAILEKINAEVRVGLKDLAAAQNREKPGKSADVDAKVRDVEGLSEAIQKELGKTSFKIRLDQTEIRNQIQNALTAQPFRVSLAVEGLTGLQQAAQGAATERASTPDRGAARSEIPPEIVRAVRNTKGLAEQVNNLYTGVKIALDQAGKTFGRFGVEAGNEAEKLMDLVEFAGNSIPDWVRMQEYKTKSGRTGQRAVGGTLIEALRAQGIEPGTIGNLAYGLRQTASMVVDDKGNLLSQLVRQLPQMMANAVTEATPQQAPASPAKATMNVAQMQPVIAAAAAAAAEETAGNQQARTATRGAAPAEVAGAPAEPPRVESFTLDALINQLRTRVGSFPAGRRVSANATRAFDIDPATGEQLTTEQIKTMNRGQLPTPLSPSRPFSYAPLIATVATGFFNDLAEVLGKGGRGTGEFIRYDPGQAGESEEIFNLVRRGRATIDGRRVKRLNPQEAFRRLLEADRTTSGRGVAPEEDFAVAGPSGQSFIDRIATKLVPEFARAATRSPQLIKGGAEAGKQSGLFNFGTKSLEDVARLDFELIEAMKDLEGIQALIGLQEGQGPQTRQGRLTELERRQERARARVSDLVDRGADPEALRYANFTPQQRAEFLRARREAQIDANLENQERVAGRAGLPDFQVREERQAEAARRVAGDIAAPVVDRIARVAEGIFQNVNPEDLVEYEVGRYRAKQGARPFPFPADVEGEGAGTLRKLFAEGAKELLGEFRAQIGDTTSEGLEAPRGFESISAAIQAGFARISEVGPGAGAFSNREFEARERRGQVTFSEQDRRLAEAAAYRRQAERFKPTALDVEFAQLQGQTQTRLEEVRRQRRQIETTEAARFAQKRGLSISRVGDAPPDTEFILSSGSLPRDERLRKARADFRRSFAQSAAGREFRELGEREQQLETRLTQAHDDRARIRRAAERLLARESGQRPIAQNIREASTEEVRLGRYAPGQIVPGEFVRSSPSRTGEETAALIRSRRAIPEVVRREALDLLEQGAAPGLTRADVERRAGRSQVEGLTGDKTRDVTRRLSAVGEVGEEPIPSPDAGGAGGRRSPRGRVAGNSFDGFRGGVIHVIIDGQPVKVAVVEGPGGGGGGGGESFQDQFRRAGAEDRRRRAAFRAETGAANLRALETQIERLRTKEGKSDEQIKAAISKEFPAAAQLLFEPSMGIGGSSSVASVRQRINRALPAGIDRLPVTVREVATKEADAADERRAALSAEAERAERRILKRGFTASVTDVFQGGFFEKQAAAVDRFRREGGQLAGLLDKQAVAATDLRHAEENLAAARQVPGTKGARLVQAAEESRTKAAENLAGVSKEVAAQEERVAAARAKLPGRLQAAGNLAVGGLAAAGAIGIGGIAFTIGSQIAGVIQQGLVEATLPLIDRATGFSLTAARVTGQLSEAARQAPEAPSAIAGVLGRAGVGAGAANIISGSLINRAEVEAGNKALAEQIDLLNTAIRIDQENGGKLFDKGLVSTTGGILGTAIGGVPSTSELLGNAFRDLPTAGQFAGDEQSRTALEAQLSSVRQRLAQSPGNRGLLSELSQVRGALNALGGLSEQADIGARRIEFFNKQLEKGGESTLRFARAIDKPLDAATRREQAQALSDIGATDLANAVRDQKISLINARTGGAVTDPAQILAGLDNFASGLFRKDPAQLMKELEPRLRAQFQTQDALRDLRLNTLNPAAGAIARATEPLTLSARLRDDGRGIITEDDVALYDELQAAQRKNLDLAKQFVAENLKLPGIIDQFGSSLDRVVSLGQQIADIQIGRETVRAAFAAKQYGEQIRVANRSLEDARALAGGVGSEFGRIQRQMYELGRESRALGLDLSQRQVNFQTAIAGITAPGLTGEERAARIQQAKVEAEYAQKQLNIQKELFGLEGKTFEITVDRNVEDLIRQIGLLEEGRKIVLDDAAAQKKIQLLTASLQKELQVVNTIFSAAQERATDLIGVAGQLAAETAKDLSEFTGELLKNYETIYRGIARLMSSGSSGGGEGGSSGGGGNKRYNAEGLVGMTFGATDLGYAGEAGREGVAIIKDPRRIRLSDLQDGYAPMAAANSNPIVIDIHDNTFNGDEEKQRLVRDVTQAVERAIGFKGAILGGRRP